MAGSNPTRSLAPPKVKLTYRQRQRLISQGRCFTCRQKGHRSQECKRSLNSSLAKLPVELLDSICMDLVYPNGTDIDLPFVYFMQNLRLTCREINAKTFSFFNREGFRAVRVSSSYKGFQRLSEISQHPPAASKIERLSFLPAESEMMNREEYRQLQAQLLKPSLNKRQQREIALRLRDVDLEQADKVFMNYSAAGGIMLTLAMKNMPNLRDISIHSYNKGGWPGRQEMPSSELTTSRMFSIVLSSLAFSGVKPRSLEIFPAGYGRTDQGVSIQALCVPSEFLPCLSELRHLQLPLETNDRFLPNTTLALLSPSMILMHTPLLTTLWLSFLDKDWKNTTTIFMEIVETVVLLNLRYLTIDGLRCTGTYLELFLQNHSCLEHLVLKNLDIKGPGTFANVLDKASSIKNLISFRCRQIAQDGYRTKFSTLYDVEATEHGWARTFDERVADEDTTWPALWVSKYKYIGSAEEWEGVSRKLRDLSRDVEVTTDSRDSDWEGEYNWEY